MEMFLSTYVDDQRFNQSFEIEDPQSEAAMAALKQAYGLLLSNLSAIKRSGGTPTLDTIHGFRANGIEVGCGDKFQANNQYAVRSPKGVMRGHINVDAVDVIDNFLYVGIMPPGTQAGDTIEIPVYGDVHA